MGALACSLIALVLAGGGGEKFLATTLQDDALFLHRPAAQVRATARQVAALGADHVRLTASWSAIAPEPRARSVPGAPFDASDSRTYPAGAFRALDTAVKAVADAGLTPMLDVGFWAPRWAVRRGSTNGRERWAPDPGAFADFATALARRYSGAFPDPDDARRDLPAVRLWTPWNEPNHPSFLAPQWIPDARAPGRYRPESPHVYRGMYAAAYDAIKRVSPRNQVLLGGTASTGSPVPGRGAVPPLAFVRALACVDGGLRPLRVPECRRYRPLRYDGFAAHPYSRMTAPGAADPLLDDAPIADTARLSGLLGALRALGRLVGPGTVWDTEYGYESREDDPFAPFTRDQQAQFLGWATYLAWRDPGTRMFAQFLLRDVDPRESGRPAGTRGAYRDFQSGLLAADGTPKPAAKAFKLPFYVERREGPAGPVLMVFGGVRPGSGRRIVRVEAQDGASGAWTPLRTYGSACDGQDAAFLTDRAGYFERAAPAGRATAYRLAWRHDDGTWEVGVPVPAVPAIRAPGLLGG